MANAKNTEDSLMSVPVTFTVILKKPVEFIRMFAGSTDMISKEASGDSSTVTFPPKVELCQVGPGSTVTLPPNVVLCQSAETTVTLHKTMNNKPIIIFFLCICPHLIIMITIPTDIHWQDVFNIIAFHRVIFAVYCFIEKGCIKG